jgi:hypothetical protein
MVVPLGSMDLFFRVFIPCDPCAIDTGPLATTNV